MKTLEAEKVHLEQLLRSPRLYEYARKIETAIEQEAQKRREFYEQMSDGEKVEFINGEIVYHFRRSPLPGSPAKAVDFLYHRLMVRVTVLPLAHSLTHFLTAGTTSFANASICTN